MSRKQRKKENARKAAQSATPEASAQSVPAPPGPAVTPEVSAETERPTSSRAGIMLGGVALLPLAVVALFSMSSPTREPEPPRVEGAHEPGLWAPLPVLPDLPPLPPEAKATFEALRARLVEELGREPPGRRPLGPGERAAEAISNYGLAFAHLSLAAGEESGLRDWATNAARPLPDRLQATVKNGRDALRDLERGVNSSEVGKLEALPSEAGRAVALGRLALAEARLHLAGGSMRAACERAASVLRLGRDLAGLGEASSRLGKAVELEAVRALGAWLSGPLPPNTQVEDLFAVARTIALAMGERLTSHGGEGPTEGHSIRLVELALHACVRVESEGRKP